MRNVGPEARTNYSRRQREGFFEKYLSGKNILDIGYKGRDPDAVPITETAIGIELNYPGYDGKRLPFQDASQDAVFASHVLEHIQDYRSILTDWYRVLRIGGYMLIMVPHRDLYERKSALPSRFNLNHKRFYTPASLLCEVEQSLPVGGFRVRSLRDVDADFDYSLPPEMPPDGSYEIEMVLEKIRIPCYAHRLRQRPEVVELLTRWASLVLEIGDAEAHGDAVRARFAIEAIGALQLPPFGTLKEALSRLSPAFYIQDAGVHSLDWFRALLRSSITSAPFSRDFYLEKHPDLARVAHQFGDGFAHEHFVNQGYFEDRIAHPDPGFFD
jgi:SAM-dependent methyltransferase